MLKQRLLTILFLLIGLALLGFGLKERIAIKNCSPIEAVITGEVFDESYDSEDHRTTTHRFPVYTFTLNGIEQEYKASVSDEKTPIGTEVTLYLDDSGKIHEQSSVSFFFLAGSLTTLFSLVFAFVGGRRRHA